MIELTKTVPECKSTKNSEFCFQLKQKNISDDINENLLYYLNK